MRSVHAADVISNPNRSALVDLCWYVIWKASLVHEHSLLCSAGDWTTQASLSGVEPLMQKIHSEIRRVDAGILAAVRQQSNSGTKAKEDLAAATHAVQTSSNEYKDAAGQELMYKIREIKTKAEQSETMVQEICRDIKKLDFAKKHITTSITALHRLTMLVSAVEQLQVMSSKRQYKEAAAQLEVTTTLVLHAVNQLCSHFEAYRDVPKITELREKFKNIKQILKSHVFSDFSSLGTGKETEEANLLQQLSDACLVVDALEPSVREELVKNFCSKELTSYRQIFEGAELAKLDKTERRYAWIKRRLRTNEEIWKIFPPAWHVAYLLCIQFCKLTRAQLVEILDNLKEKPDVGTLLTALQRTLEFEEELAEKFSGGMVHSRSREGGVDTEESDKGKGNTVSDIRKKYEKKLAVHHESGSESDRDSQKDLSVPGAGVFQRILRAYANKLFARLPKGGTGIVAAATGTDGQIKTSDKDERVICYIVNTAEYCHKTAGELAENVSKMIDSHFADKVDMSEVQDEFSAVITKALITLVHGLETKFDAEMAAMTRVPWATLESVAILQLAASLGPHFYLNIYKCKQISETGAQQMLLDTQAVKTILLDIPALGRQVILSPVDSVAGTYRALLPEGTPSEFQRILELKGLKKVDQQTILDDFNKHGPGIKHPTTAPSVVVSAAPIVATAPAAAIPTTAAGAGAAGAISREDVLTRAAALGRGAATTGFKRFLALTEAAKDRKDGPFRKLFNP
ncbi:HIT domain protein [Asimina triloba]